MNNVFFYIIFLLIVNSINLLNILEQYKFKIK